MVVALALALPFSAGGGCGNRTACFAYTQGEYAQNGNACPSPTDALASFTDPACPGPVVSVDGPGSFDGEICCYPVTEDSIVPDCGNTSSTGGSTSTGPPPPPTGGFSSGTGIPTCTTTCADTLVEGGQPCTNGGGPFASLVACASSTCTVQCPTFLAGGAVVADATCEPCLAAGCPSELMMCQES
jgi:hypothetical protein